MVGLIVGGDDYINKSFSFDEVVVCIWVVLWWMDVVLVELTSSVLRYADLELDEDWYEV